MAREKVGIILTPATIVRLNEISEEMGLSKSQAIAMLINNYYIDNNKKEKKKKKK